jgi:hypothetical protein
LLFGGYLGEHLGRYLGGHLGRHLGGYLGGYLGDFIHKVLLGSFKRERYKALQERDL